MPDSAKIDEFIVHRIRLNPGISFRALWVEANARSLIDIDGFRVVDSRLQSLRRRGIIRYVPRKQGGNGWEVCDE